MTKISDALVAISVLALALATGAPVRAAAAADPAARPGDKEMTCEVVAQERLTIQAAVTKRGEDQAKSAKRKQMLGGFARSFASAAAPSLLGQMGGNSMLAGAAVQAANQTAAQTMTAPSAAAAVPTAAPAPTTAEQARLDRLTRIGAYRQCPEA